MKLRFLFFSLLLFGITFGEDLKVFNGESIFIELEKNIDNLSVDNKPIPVIKAKNKFFGVVPVGYHERGIKELKLDSKTYKSIKIVEKDYKKETIQVEPKLINYDNETKQRIDKEREIMLKIYKKRSNKQLFNSAFITPLDSFITSDYGKARVFNNTLKSYHGGTDFRASVGTKIKASNDGIVALVGDRFLSGRTIVLDHGFGIYSVYFHLEKPLVKEGEKVKIGQIIALSGQSGRVSGAHLHFGIIINGKNVNPIEFINSTKHIF